MFHKDKKLKQFYLKDKCPKLDEEQITITSFNLLADLFCLTKKKLGKSSRLEKIDNKYLEWEYRRDITLDIFSKLDSDVFCVQEMDAPLHEDFFERMRERGYEGVMQQEKKKPKKVGLATFYRKSRFELFHENSRSRALIVTLKMKEKSCEGVETLLYVTNVHLEGHYTETKKRFSQIKSSLEIVARHQHSLTHLPQKKRKNLEEGEEERSEEEKKLREKFRFVSFVAGDFNSGEESGIYRCLVKGGLQADYRDSNPHTCHLEHTDKDFESPFTFQSTYKSVLGKEPPFTFSGLSKESLSTIDFIFCEKGKVECLAVLNHFEPSQQSDIKRWVLTEKIPSDHFPISAVMKLK